MDLNELTRRFLLGESKEDRSIKYHIDVVQKALTSISAVPNYQQRKIDEAINHLKELKRKSRILEEQVKVLQEQVTVLTENAHTIEESSTVSGGHMQGGTASLKKVIPKKKKKKKKTSKEKDKKNGNK